MSPRQPPYDASTTFRVAVGTATVVLLVAALAVGDSPQLYAAAGAFGAIWWAWDLLLEHVFRPLGEWVRDTLMSGGVGLGGTDTRLSLDELIALLEGHLRRGSSRQVDINAAIRLEEIYRTIKKDPERARQVIAIVRERYPDEPRLKHFAQPPGQEAPDDEPAD